MNAPAAFDLEPCADPLAEHLAFLAALEKDTPAKRWYEASHDQSRASIKRMLGLEGFEHADYATMPFRAIVDGHDRAWIACAIGCMPIYDRDRVTSWTHLDIRDVLLWDPRTNRIHVDGEAENVNHLILPDMQDDRMTVYADPRAFLTAWAGRRIRIAEIGVKRAKGEWAHPVVEGTDGGLPGALVIGNLEQPGWHRVTARALVAGAGTNKAKLYQAVVASANLPRCEGAAGGDGG